MKARRDENKQPDCSNNKDKKEKKAYRKGRTEKAMVAEENKSAWADSDSEESSSGTSSSSESEDVVQCLIVDDTEEVIDLCCSNLIVAAVCGNCNSEVKVQMLSLYYGWNWHGYYVVCYVCIACCLYAVQLFHCIRTIISISAVVAVLWLCFLTRIRGRAAIPHSHLPAALLALMLRVVN
ncbi:hypothetical protein F511_04975 [Dorcoceras hygrometricum]|uniref:Uncharacterized protein n=1 Tax=Dorcoceras hygrometricum TaxID=472368 RepID=A0A2Z7BW36_9LAMI|nr:hypothetical protein F511_04975 [Dorcoceras hygrometricum]